MKEVPQWQVPRDPVNLTVKLQISHPMREEEIVKAASVEDSAENEEDLLELALKKKLRKGKNVANARRSLG